MMTDEGRRQLALDIVEGRVFGSWSLKLHNDVDMLGVIFLPLSFLDKDEIPEDVVHVYEYLDKAGPISVNGYPTFTSCKMLVKGDAAELEKYISALRKQRNKFMTEGL